jgi:hypothetical protein
LGDRGQREHGRSEDNGGEDETTHTDILDSHELHYGQGWNAVPTLR